MCLMICLPCLSLLLTHHLLWCSWHFHSLFMGKFEMRTKQADRKPPISSKHGSTLIVSSPHSVALFPLPSPRLALMRKNLHKQINKQTFYPNWRSPASLLLAPALFGFSATQPLLLSGPQLVIQCQVGLTGMQCQWQGQGQPKLGVTSAKSGAKTESTNQINHDYRMIFTAVTQACGCTVQK